MNKSWLSLACSLALVGSATVSQAAVITTDIFAPGPGGDKLGTAVETIDYSAGGVAVAVGAGPFGAPLAIGQTFELLLMTHVVGFEKSNGSSAATGIAAGSLFSEDATREITAVAKFTEIVVDVTAAGATFAVVPGSGTFSLYYDAVLNRDYATGLGFDDGSLIYQATAVSGTSNFDVTELPSATSPGVGLGSINVTGAATSIDTTVFTGLLGGLSINFVNPEGQASFPAPNPFPTGFFNAGLPYERYVVQANDLGLRFDGSSVFMENAVPEPSTLALVGLTLAGLGWTSRRRQKAHAA
jgi:PEP-CTERM motif